MKKSLILIPVLAAIAAISACGNSGEKGRTLARIDGKNFTEGDFDLRLNALDDARREEVLRDPDLRRKEFETFLQNRLYALAALKSPAGKDKSLKRRQALIDQRVMARYYFETHLGANGGRTHDEILAYYNADPSRFTDDSGRVQPFSRAMSRVVDSLLVRDANLDSAYEANKENYKARASAEVSIIRTATRKEAAQALKALQSGATFAETAARHSNHASKNNQGRFGRVFPGENLTDLGTQALLDSLFFNEKTRLQPGGRSGIVANGAGFAILQMDAYTAEHFQPLDEVRARVAADYVRAMKLPADQNVLEALKAKYAVRFVPRKTPTEQELRAYYDANKERYESPETFELYHVESSDENALSAAAAKAGNLEQFKALASRTSENALTRSRQGYLGTVKRDFILPYGVGMMPSLFSALDEIDETKGGRVGEVLQSSSSWNWHAFWLVKKAPPALKPFDRVRGSVMTDLLAGSVDEITPQDSLAVIGKSGRVIREDDVLFLRREIPSDMQDRYTREALVDYLIAWEVTADEARARGLDRERKLRAILLQEEDRFWAGVYRDSILAAGWEQAPAALDKAFKERRALFAPGSTTDDWKPYAQDVAGSLFLSTRDFEIEYNTNPERYMRDSTPIPFEEAQPQIFAGLKLTAHARLDAAVLEKLKKRFKVRIEDPSLSDPPLEPTPETYKKAQDLHYERKFDQALDLYGKLRAKYPDRAGLQDSVSFGMAQVYIEQERYPQALAEYRRVNYLYPNSANAYKAMFMVGFIQAEHQRQDSAAVRSFEAMLAKHPNSDLSDDADWMIRNIRSGGKLMPTLEDDAEDVEGADSAK